MWHDASLPKHGFHITSNGNIFTGIVRACDEDFYDVELFSNVVDAKDNVNSLGFEKMPRSGFKIQVSCEGCS